MPPVKNKLLESDDDEDEPTFVAAKPAAQKKGIFAGGSDDDDSDDLFPNKTATVAVTRTTQSNLRATAVKQEEKVRKSVVFSPEVKETKP